MWIQSPVTHDIHIPYSRQLIPSNPTEHQLWYMHNHFGASLRDSVGYAKTPHKYESRLLADIDYINPTELREIFKDPGSHSASHFLVTLYPLPGDRTKCFVVPASLYVFRTLMKKYPRSRLDDMEELYDLFRKSTIGGAAAGLIFEGRMHVILMKRRTLRLYPVLCDDANKGTKNLIYTATTNRTEETEFELPESQLFRFTLENKPRAHGYYIPESSDFPGLDSLLFFDTLDNSPPILLMFKITHNETNNAKASGLLNVDKLGFPSDVRKYYVVVSPDSIFPEVTVPMEYFGDELEMVKQAPNRKFPTYHYPIPRCELFPKESLKDKQQGRRTGEHGTW